MKESEFVLEADRIAEAVETLELEHVVITSVARDDLPDGGASGFVHCLRKLKNQFRNLTTEVLVPDFKGDSQAIEKILDQGPDVLNHNLETVPRLYKKVRPGSSYKRSLQVLSTVSNYRSSTIAKTGIMLGLGERFEEVEDLINDSVEAGAKIFTAGQYMRPTRAHLPVENYLAPDEFSKLRSRALELGFASVSVEPLSRSSFRAETHLRVVRELENQGQ